MYHALEQISERTANDPVITLKRAVENARPLLEVKSRRVGGATYQVPVEVKPHRGTTLGAAVAGELLAAAPRALDGRAPGRRDHGRVERAGPSVKRREDMHKMAEANKAFAHYRW